MMAWIDHQRVKGIGPRLISNRFTGTTRHPVAIALNKCIKCINMIKLWVNLHFLQTRYHERILNWIIYDKRKIHFVI